MSDCKVTIKVTKDEAEKFSLEGEYFMGVIVKVKKVEEGREIECNFAELGSASTSTRIRAIDCLSEEIKNRKKDIVLSNSGILPELLGMFIRDEILKKEKKDGDSE